MSDKLKEARKLLNTQDFSGAYEKIREAEQSLDLPNSQNFNLYADIHFHYYMVHQLADVNWREVRRVNLKPKAVEHIIISLVYEYTFHQFNVNIMETRAGRALKKALKAYGGFFPHLSRKIMQQDGRIHDSAIESILNDDELQRMLGWKRRAAEDLDRMWTNYKKNEDRLKEKINRKPIIERFEDEKERLEYMPNQIILFKRWNSVDPNYPGYAGSLGGGYYLRWEDKGIVIDPGYEYLYQFFRDPRNFGIGDINAVITTHAHDDHTHQIETIYSLFHKKDGEKRIPEFLGSEGTVIKFSQLFANTRDRLKIVALEANRNTTSPIPVSQRHQETILDSIPVKWISTIHNEAPWMQTNTGIGIRLDLDSPQGQFGIGITGDGKYFHEDDYYDELAVFFEGCQLLVTHVGAPRPSTNHLGLEPAANLIGDVAPTLAILTEFGLDFRENAGRIDAMRYVQGLVHSNTNVLPGDSGLCIRIPELTILLSEGYSMDRPDTTSASSRFWIDHNWIIVGEKDGTLPEPDLGIVYRDETRQTDMNSEY